MASHVRVLSKSKTQTRGPSCGACTRGSDEPGFNGDASALLFDAPRSRAQSPTTDLYRRLRQAPQSQCFLMTRETGHRSPAALMFPSTAPPRNEPTEVPSPEGRQDRVEWCVQK
eukprot:scaffold14989_cov113-Isochrysis_galbana.AAC.4